MLTRRSFLASAAAGSLAAQPAHPLNVIVILADDLGWADVGCNGADLHETPHIDRLARQGMRFTNGLAAAPICSPTRASIMTGKCPARLHMTIWSEGAITPPRNRKLLPASSLPDLPLSEVTLAERLKERGYQTAAIGKWHLGGASNFPETQGFDVNIGGTHWGAPPTYWYPYRGEFGNARELRYVPDLAGGIRGEYLTDRLTDEAVRFLRNAVGGLFFLYLAHHAVHTPIEAKGAVLEKYRAKIRAGLNHRNAAYAAMTESLDDSVGRVLAEVEHLQIQDRTVVVFTSDNGGYINPFAGQPVTSNAPLRSGKGSLYEGGLRVPLVVRWPGLTRPGTHCDEPVYSADLFPTLLEAAGLPGGAVDGLNLHPLLADPTARLDRDALFFHYPHYYPTTTPVSAVRTREWKLLHYYEDGHDELYHLARDPAESTNLASSEPRRAAELRERLDRWLTAVSARLPEANPAFVP